MPLSQLRRGSVVPTGWDINGRRDSFQSWPSSLGRVPPNSFLAQLLAGRFKDSRSGSMPSTDRFYQNQIKMENTYKLGPEPDNMFQAHVVQKIIMKVLSDYLGEREYDGAVMGQKSVTLAEMIKEKVKRLRYDRYKIIAWVVICQKGCNDIRVASKGLWDENLDSSAEAVYENKHLYAMGVVYATYQE